MSDTAFTAYIGRDNGKRFRVIDIDPLTLAGFALRLVSALRIPDFSVLLELAAPANSDAAIDNQDENKLNALLAVLRGCDPDAVHKLVSEILTYTEIAADPKHPEAWRAISVQAGDIKELRTLGAVVMSFVKTHLMLGN